MRRYGAFEVASRTGALHEEPVPGAELDDVRVDADGRAFTRAAKPDSPNVVPLPVVDGDADGRRRAGVEVDGRIVRGFPTPSGRLEFWSGTLAEWGWPELAVPGYTRSHIHRENLEDGQMVLISTFRVPIQIHTRSANAKWLDEIAHTNPLWIHPGDARGHRRPHRRPGARGDRDRPFRGARLGHRGIRPGVVACSHHMGRWKVTDHGQNQAMATVDLERGEEGWSLRRRKGGGPYESADADTSRIWWTDVGVHQNLTFPVHPDPISGSHCWHQAVRVSAARPGDAYGDISVDAGRSGRVFRKWLGYTRPAGSVSPDGTRRPYWLLRPVRPTREAYQLPADDPAGG